MQQQPKTRRPVPTIILDLEYGYEVEVPVMCVVRVEDITTEHTQLKRVWYAPWRKVEVNVILCRSIVTVRDLRTGRERAYVTPNSADAVLRCLMRNGASTRQLKRLGMDFETTPNASAWRQSPDNLLKDIAQAAAQAKTPPKEKTATPPFTLAERRDGGGYTLLLHYKTARTNIFRLSKGGKTIRAADMAEAIGIVRRAVGRRVELPREVLHKTIVMVDTAFHEAGHELFLERNGGGITRPFALSFLRAALCRGWIEAGNNREARHILERYRAGKFRIPDAPVRTASAPTAVLKPTDFDEEGRASLNEREQLRLAKQDAQREGQFTNRRHPTYDFLKEEVQLLNEIRAYRGKPPLDAHDTWKGLMATLSVFGGVLDRRYPEYFERRGTTLRQHPLEKRGATEA